MKKVGLYMQNKKKFYILGLLLFLIFLMMQTNIEFLNKQLSGFFSVIFVIVSGIFIVSKFRRRNFFFGGIFNSFYIFLTICIYFIFDTYSLSDTYSIVITGILLFNYILLLLALNTKLKLNTEEFMSNMIYFLFMFYIEILYLSILIIVIFYLILFIKLYFNKKEKEIMVYLLGFIFNMMLYFIIIIIVTLMFWGI